MAFFGNGNNPAGSLGNNVRRDLVPLTEEIPDEPLTLSSKQIQILREQYLMMYGWQHTGNASNVQNEVANPVAVIPPEAKCANLPETLMKPAEKVRDEKEVAAAKPTAPPATEK